MAEYKKGQKPGPGRPKGTPNKRTVLAREAIAQLVENNAHRMSGWLDDIAADEKHGPLVAYRCLLDVLEYNLPKLARTELANADGKAFKVVAVDQGDLA